jgi:hypothetical protein
MSFARSSTQSKCVRRWAMEEPAVEQIDEPTVDPADMERLSNNRLPLGRELVGQPNGWDCVMDSRTRTPPK